MAVGKLVDFFLGRRTCGIIIRAGCLMALVAAGAQAQDSQADDPVERDMNFVRRVSEGTQLYTLGQYEQALAIFEPLLRTHAELDEDGFVAMAVGDCWMHLKRPQQARQAFHAALARHPNLAEQIEGRLIEADLAGPIDQALIERLRKLRQTRGHSLPQAGWYLARALTQQAGSLLQEAAEVFREASTAMAARGSNCPPRSDTVPELTALLQRLNTVIDAERSAGLLAETALDEQDKLQSRDIAQPAVHLESLTLVTRTPAQRSYIIRTGDSAEGLVVTSADQTLPLTSAQQREIRSCQEKIAAILQEANMHAPVP